MPGLASLCATNAHAQLGNILKKAKQALETVTGTEQTTTGNAAAGAATVAIPSGGTMQNPFAQAVDI